MDLNTFSNSNNLFGALFEYNKTIEGDSITIKNPFPGRFIESIIKNLAPIHYERNQAEGRRISVDSIIEAAKKLIDAFPAISPNQAVLFAAGLPMSGFKANNLAEVLCSIDDSAKEENLDEVPDAFKDAYIDGASRAGDAEVKILWERLLERELDDPGCFDDSDVKVLGLMGKTEAETFKAVCSSSVTTLSKNDDRPNPVLYESENDTFTYNDGDISKDDVDTLISLGLLLHREYITFKLIPHCRYGFRCAMGVIELENLTDEAIIYHFSDFLLLPRGIRLAKLCNIGNDPHLYERIKEHTKNFGLSIRLCDE